MRPSLDDAFANPSTDSLNVPMNRATEGNRGQTFWEYSHIPRYIF